MGKGQVRPWTVLQDIGTWRQPTIHTFIHTWDQFRVNEPGEPGSSCCRTRSSLTPELSGGLTANHIFAAVKTERPPLGRSPVGKTSQNWNHRSQGRMPGPGPESANQRRVPENCDVLRPVGGGGW